MSIKLTSVQTGLLYMQTLTGTKQSIEPSAFNAEVTVVVTEMTPPNRVAKMTMWNGAGEEMVDTLLRTLEIEGVVIWVNQCVLSECLSPCTSFLSGFVFVSVK